MSVWLTIPSARPPEEAEKVLRLYREQGYKIALWRDSGASCPASADLACDGLCGVGGGQYPGYAVAVNHLIELVMKVDSDAEWFIAAGDDVLPDPKVPAEKIAAQCQGYFTKLHYGNEAHHAAEIGPLSTFGVCQPTGDRWQDTPHSRVRYGENRGALIDRVCGSAWYGREYCRRMYGGKGPLFEGYRHMFVDEEAQEVAIRMGVLWQRRDLTQLHQHALRHPEPGKLANAADLVVKAPHAVKWNTSEHWNESRKMFEERKAAGFPGHEPL